MSLINLAVLNYTNSLPFVYGLKHFEKSLMPYFNIIEDIPSACCKKLLDNEVDIALVSSVTLLKLSYYEIINKFCISACGPVNSVFLYANRKLEDIRHIKLDSHSNTSNVLIKVLLSLTKNHNVIYYPSSHQFDTDAEVIIGDRTFALKNTYTFRYDLSELWYEITKMPFVFALWVSNKEISNHKLRLLNQALRYGLNQRSQLINDLQLKNFNLGIDLQDYLKNKIQYLLTEEKRQALNYFLTLAKKYV